MSPETISPALVKKIRDVHRKILPLPEMLRTFSGKGEGVTDFPMLFPPPSTACPSAHPPIPLHLPLPSKPGSSCLPPKPSLSDPGSAQRDRSSEIFSPQGHALAGGGCSCAIRAQQEAWSRCLLLLPHGVPRSALGSTCKRWQVTYLSISASLRKPGASSGNRLR